ncbi:MAG: hypothetical protein JO032_11640, partial [Alphaproteobacteria bacterium]|nr:hypothetical protein [Alphaproteobacteria bacterium]
MTLAEAGMVFAYWADNPPAHLTLQTVARMLGWKPAANATSSLDEIVAMAPPGLAVNPSGGTGMPMPMFDTALLRR